GRRGARAGGAHRSRRHRRPGRPRRVARGHGRAGTERRRRGHRLPRRARPRLRGEPHEPPRRRPFPHRHRRERRPVTMALPGWRHVYSGKVRELYASKDADDGRMLVVASDRVSAFDYVLEPGIPEKGALLTRLSLWWFGQLAEFPNHLANGEVPPAVAGRAMLVKSLDMLPVECVVRGYLTGSGWAEYQAAGTVCAIPLPEGLHDGDRLPEPLFTPAYKAPMGEHDENISFAQAEELVGPERAAA